MTNIEFTKSTPIDKYKLLFKNNLKEVYTYPINKCDLYINNYLYKLKFTVNSNDSINIYEHLDILAKIIPFIPNQIQNIKLILMRINICMHGQTILNKYKDNINKLLFIDDIIYIIQNTSQSWTFPIYKFYINLLKSYDTSIIETIPYISDIINRFLIVNSFSNKDDRIYRDVVNEEFILKYAVLNDSIINVLITNSMCSYLPNKYVLRKLKYINMIIPDLHKYFDILLNYIINTYTRLPILNTIMKYYYRETTILKSRDIYSIIKLFSNEFSNLLGFNSNKVAIFNNLYERLNNDLDKNILVIYSLLENGHTFDKGIINGDLYIKELESVLHYMFTQMDLKQVDHIYVYDLSSFKKIMTGFSLYNISKCFPFDNIKQKSILLLMMPFIVANNGENCKKFNKVRYCITKYIRNVKHKKAIIRKLKIYPLLNELKSLKPNTKLSIFKDGTNFYKINKEKFNYIPPVHIFPGQLQNLDIGEYFIKEKADGILVDILPKDIYPNILCNYTKLKAEYIEELDLYMVFDIDIIGSTCERHMYINSFHPYGQKKIITVSTMEELIDNINMEREKLSDFLKKPYDNYRWYPKPAWKIIVDSNNHGMGNHEFIKFLTDIINNTDDIDEWLCNDINLIKYDGLILTPFNGSDEMKIKPKKFYTIDLLYKNKKWLDRDNNEWDIVVEDEVKMMCSENIIMRCYPIKKDNTVLYYAKELRHDKLKPNPFKVVATIMDLYNIEYKYSYNKIYHDINTTQHYIYWYDIVLSNKNMIKKLITIIEELKPNGDIVDFGCGNARALDYITNYNTYTGIDMDVNMLSKAIKSYQNNTKTSFGYCDLIDIDKSILLKRNESFNIILCINSIMHFFNDKFFMKLKKIMKPNSLMLFNVVEMENNKFNLDENHFIERKDNIVYYKFPIHSDIKEEPYIDIDMINKKLIEYKLEIVNTFTSTDDNITKYYKWYLIKNI
jgi:SAM-dependent methyltransferase